MQRENALHKKCYGHGLPQRSDGPERAFTGLEAAIVLIAFVVVASVFSYMVLNTGFFVTQKSQSVIFTAVGQTTSTLFLSGNIVGIGEAGSTRELDKINFSCSISPSGSPVDFSKVVMTFSNATLLDTLTPDPAIYNPAGCVERSGTWAVYRQTAGQGGSDTLLEPDEQFDISVCPAQPVIRGDTFHLEIKPPVGVAMSISRTVPAIVNPVTQLY